MGMRMTEEEFHALLMSNPFLQVAASSPIQLEQPVKVQPLTSDKIKQTLEKAQKDKTSTSKYLNLKVYIFTDGFIHTQIGNKVPDFPEHGKIAEKYDSVKEYYRCLELRELEKVGKISNLRRQVKFELQPAFTRGDERIRAISYTADFCYEENGKKIVEDVKGLNKKTGEVIKTKEFDIKWKMMRYQFPEYVFRIEAR